MNKRVVDDDQVDSFLKKNQPVAPAIDEKKVHATLLAKLGFAPSVSNPGQRARATWIAFSGALAAAVLAFFVISKPMNVPAPAIAPQATTTESEWDEELFAEELPALEVGEDYMDLMAQK